VRLSLGEVYMAVAPQLFLAALNQTVVVTLFAYTLYLLVMRRGRPAVFALAVGACTLLSVAWRPPTTMALLISLIGGQLVGVVIYGIVRLKDHLTKH